MRPFALPLRTLTVAAICMNFAPAARAQTATSQEKIHAEKVHTKRVHTEEIEKRRAVVRVHVGPGADSYQYLFVDTKDGAPVVLDSFVTQRGYLGLSFLDLTPELRLHLGAPRESGVMISSVESAGPADRAGLRAGDLLLSIDGRDIRAGAEVLALVAQGSEGRTLKVVALRDGKSQTFTPALETRERGQVDLGRLLLKPHDLAPTARPVLSRDAPTVEIDPEQVEAALAKLRAHFEDPAWRARVGSAERDRRRLELRILELEEELRKLQERLGQLEE